MSSTAQKIFTVKTFKNVSQIAGVIDGIAQLNESNVQLSILGPITCNRNDPKSKLEIQIELTRGQLQSILMPPLKFGYFYNLEIGHLFISGHLTPTFLTKVNGAALASLPVGLSGIFKGLGLKQEQFLGVILALKNKEYCLIVRSTKNVLTKIVPLITTTNKNL